MKTTPRHILDEVIRAVCGARIESLTRITTGGLNKTYRVEVQDRLPVILRTARRPTPWFTDEAHFIDLARQAEVPAPDVLGVEHREHDGELLSFSILSIVRGRPLAELADDLTDETLNGLVEQCGELLAKLQSVAPEREVRHTIEPPDKRALEQAMTIARTSPSPNEARRIIEAGAEMVRDHVATSPPQRTTLAHGDWLPKHFMLDENLAITGVIDWEFAGAASPAFDIARWEVSAGARFDDKTERLLRGYARFGNLDDTDPEWIPAIATAWALEILGWQNPATPARILRCLDIISRHTDA